MPVPKMPCFTAEELEQAAALRDVLADHPPLEEVLRWYVLQRVHRSLLRATLMAYGLMREAPPSLDTTCHLLKLEARLLELAAACRTPGQEQWDEMWPRDEDPIQLPFN